MKENYINIYNNLVQLSRNKKLYLEFTSNDTFSDRLLILLIHFAFFIENTKKNENKSKTQSIYDFFFKQLEVNLREIGYGDSKINKYMKVYINNFYNILSKIVEWEKLNIEEKESIISNTLGISSKVTKLTNYFDRYFNYIKKTSLIFFLKGVIKHKF